MCSSSWCDFMRRLIWTMRLMPGESRWNESRCKQYLSVSCYSLNFIIITSGSLSVTVNLSPRFIARYCYLTNLIA